MSRWVSSQGFQPRTRASKVFVRYRCGIESKAAYPIKTQRWTLTGDDFDILAYRADEERREDEAA